MNHYPTKNYKSLYGRWSGIKQRCYNPKSPVYKYYGALGVKMCDDWFNSVDNFIDWAINHNYDPTLTIDRIDPDGDYEPSNCRWVDMKVQTNNKRNKKRIRINGEYLRVEDCSKITKLSNDVIYSRIKAGWNDDDIVHKPAYTAIKEPKPQPHTIYLTVDGETRSLSEWSRLKGISKTTIQRRRKRGWADDDAVNRPLSYLDPKTVYGAESVHGSLKLNGEIHTYLEWSELTGIAKRTLVKRRELGWTPERILTTPVNESFSRKAA